MFSFCTDKYKPAEIELKLRQMVGIIETGLFIKMAKCAYFGQADGTFNKKVV